MRLAKTTLFTLALSVCAPCPLSAQTWNTTSDYPARALRAGREGTVSYTAVIGKNGRAESCSVTHSSGWTDLDRSACNQIMLRARFEPATDANGKPAKGMYSGKFRFVIPSNH